MRKAVIVVALLATVGWGPSAFAQDQTPPQITAVRFFNSPQQQGYPTPIPFGLSPTGPWPPIGPVQELDLFVIEIDVTDVKLADQNQQTPVQFFYTKMSTWIPFRNYLSPEPPAVDADTATFTPIGYRLTGPTSATITLAYLIPRFNGVNQARLRGLIDYDVRWTVRVAIWDAEDPGQSVPPNFTYTLDAVANPGVRPPRPQAIADAGEDQTVQVGTTVELDGSGTFDAFNIGFDPTDPQVFDKNPISYTWEWLTGPQRVDPIPSDSARPWLAEVTLNTIGVYTFRLLVDNFSGPPPTTDSVNITVLSVLPQNHAPLAVILGPTRQIVVGDVITLDGTASSDPDGDALHFHWLQTDEVGGDIPAADFNRLFQPVSGVDSPVARWQAISAGTFYFRLLVDDGRLQGTARTQVEVVPAPTAGLTVERTPSGAVAQPTATDGASSPVPMPLPGACGGSLVPLALLPLLFGLMRRHAR